MAKLKYLGHSAFYLEGNGIRALIDPFLEGNPLAVSKPDAFTDLDHIFVTHGHIDHLGSAIEIAEKTGASIFTCNELAWYLANKGLKTEGMHIGGRAKFSFGRVKLVPAWHGSPIIEDGKIYYGGVACGFVIEVEGKKVYHAGDTGVTVEMQLLKEERIDVALLPIGGYYTMDAEDAAIAVGMIVPRGAIPMHYNTFPAIEADPETFAAMATGVSTDIIVLKPGEEFEF